MVVCLRFLLLVVRADISPQNLFSVVIAKEDGLFLLLRLSVASLVVRLVESLVFVVDSRIFVFDGLKSCRDLGVEVLGGQEAVLILAFIVGRVFVIVLAVF